MYTNYASSFFTRLYKRKEKAGFKYFTQFASYGFSKVLENAATEYIDTFFVFKYKVKKPFQVSSLDITAVIL